MSIYTAPSYSQMTLDELRVEHTRWVAATRAGGCAASLEPAHSCRDIVATWIARREREDMAIHGTAKFFVCQDCACVVEMFRPVRRDAPDLTCSWCGGEMAAVDVEPAEQRRVA